MPTVLDRPHHGSLPTTVLGPPEETPPPVHPGGLLTHLYPFLTPAPLGLGRLGDYLVLRVLGTGDTGIVFLAHDLTLDREVALKVFDPHLVGYHSDRQHFLHELQALVALEHENIVPVYRVGGANGVVFLSLPFLGGQTLDAWTAGSDPRPWREVIGIARQVALGLAAAHERDIVHGDLKPSNVWLESNPRGGADQSVTGTEQREPRAAHPTVKILGFGLARRVTTEQRPALQGFVGTPDTVAPEIIEGEAPSPARDLFALGAVLYEALAGEPPFRDTPAATAPEKPIHLAYRVPGLPGGVANLVMRLLARNPGVRPASAAEVAEALARLERWEPAPGFAKRKVAVTTEAEGDESFLPPAPTDQRRKLWVLPVVFVAAIGALMAFAFPQVRTGPAAPRPEPTRRIRQLPSPDLDPRPRPQVDPHAPVSSFAGLTAPAVGAAYSANGESLFVLAEDGWAFEWAAQGSGEAKRRWKAHAGSGSGIAITPGGTRIITSGKDPEGVRQLVGWDAKTLQAEDPLVGGETRVWNANTDQAGLDLSGHKGSVTALASDAKGDRIVSGGADGSVRVWNARTGEAVIVLRAHAGAIAAVAFSPDGRQILSAGRDRQVLTWVNPSE